MTPNIAAMQPSALTQVKIATSFTSLQPQSSK